MSNNIKAVIFDLDGTLISSHKNIYIATIKTMEKLNINYDVDEKIFNTKIGLHFKDIFEQMGIIVKDIEYFIDVYKKIYFDYIKYSTPYPNLYSTLQALYDKDVSINLLTTKSQEQAELILKHFNIDKYFSIILGRSPHLKIKPEPDGIFYISEKLNINVKNILMIGDTEMDVMCGQNANARTCAVTYGYREEEYLRNLKPDFVIDNLNILPEIITQYK